MGPLMERLLSADNGIDALLLPEKAFPTFFHPLRLMPQLHRALYITDSQG
jgi:hypothetical protein